MNHTSLKRTLTSLTLLSLLLAACESTSTGETPIEDTDIGLTDIREVDPISSSFCTETLTPAPHLPAGDVLELAQTEEESAEAYKFAVDHNAEIIPVDNGMSYAVWWEPESFDITKDTVLVSLGGHGGWAVKDFEVWYPQVSERKIAYLGLQWWFGRSLEDEGYYEPDRIYSLLAEQLEEKGAIPGNVIFEAFSMSSARSYGISLYDNLCGEHYFGVNIANSGQWEDGYPLYTEILTGKFGTDLFEDTRWILFCGDKDDNEYSLGHVCDGMERSKERLESFGGTVDLFIKDPDGDHGSFMINSDNVNQAMDEAEKIVETINL